MDVMVKEEVDYDVGSAADSSEVDRMEESYDTGTYVVCCCPLFYGSVKLKFLRCFFER